MNDKQVYITSYSPNLSTDSVYAELLRSYEDITLAFADGWNKLREAAMEMGRVVGKAIEAAAESLHPLVKILIDQETRAMLWAETAHPEWVAIHNRTKKARIRKKYYDRIMRGYAAEIEKEVHTHE